jgi:hypothetical protein
MSIEGTYDDAVQEVEGREPRTDAEALCLCALLWSSPDSAGRSVTC